MATRQEVRQHSDTPFEIFTVDGLFSDTELDAMTDYVKSATAQADNRPFNANTSFRNGKARRPDLAQDIYDRLSRHLPDVYVDASTRESWSFRGPPAYVMYAQVEPGQGFGIHTDTGCAYSRSGDGTSKFTVLTYLNDNFTGGATQFYDAALRPTATVVPKRGRSLAFDIDLFHAGEQVTRGVKYWIGTELVCRSLQHSAAQPSPAQHS